MPVIAQYKCPFCGASITPLTGIEWAEIAPCPQCQTPVRIPREAFAINCCVCCMFYSSILFLPLAAILVFARGGLGHVAWSLVTIPCLAMVGAGAVGGPAFLLGFLFAGRRRARTGATFLPGASTGYAAMARTVCSICGTHLSEKHKSAGLCPVCQRKSQR